MSATNLGDGFAAVPEVNTTLNTEAGLSAAHEHVFTPLINYCLTTSLAGLTGVRAFIPFFMVAILQKLYEECPLHFTQSMDWLESWPGICLLGILMVGEIVGDCIPCVDEALDCAFAIFKPVVGMTLAGSIFYGITEPTGEETVSFGAVITALGITTIVAQAKALQTLAVDAASGGVGAPLRSLVETVGVMVFAALSVYFMIAAVIVFVLLLLIIIWFFIKCWSAKRKNWLLACCTCGGDDTHHDEDSEEEMSLWNR
eukprot:gnl/TRDRNA2_/TRDRNA2_167320_c1_seq2.p1 gnl/TRDRNA2_/TRDRNA2_167320_c1~~gnl/TRDRNA2_/TRDRNA2_167320_c1_seq2.p1  ORF type:complete len:257 (+),score=38.23 gnl/TRDRNA2_/TRDRNA2_167320_c1_seq2:92-862(+)